MGAAVRGRLRRRVGARADRRVRILRPLRDRPLFRVLPVLTVSALALVGAALHHAVALAAVGVLGLAVALVLSAQDRRQRELDIRVRLLEHQLRNAREDETLAP